MKEMGFIIKCLELAPPVLFGRAAHDCLHSPHHTVHLVRSVWSSPEASCWYYCWVSTGLLTQCAGTQDPLDAFTCVRNDGNCSLPSAYALGFTQVSAPLPAPGVHTACQWMLRTDQLAEHECHCRLL